MKSVQKYRFQNGWDIQSFYFPKEHRYHFFQLYNFVVVVVGGGDAGAAAATHSKETVSCKVDL